MLVCDQYVLVSMHVYTTSGSSVASFVNTDAEGI